jgi:hydroxyethylthiazole kinase-like uncharacterized protein yjeF
MLELPAAIYTGEQVRRLDRIAIDELGIPGYTLMCRAGEAALACLQRRWPKARSLAVVCGPGNNGGDGYVVARLARRAGLDVRAFAVVPADQLRGDALTACREFEASGGRVESLDPGAASSADVVVDALLGTGTDRALAGDFAAAVAAINAAGRPVLALDIPSGLDADAGRRLGDAVRAAATITFVGLKAGLFLGDGVDCCGDLEFSDLGIPADVYARAEAPIVRLGPAALSAALPRRRRSAHKGAHGALLVIGGAPGMSGAARLAAEAGLRAGAGLVRVATHPDSVNSVMAGRPEIMCYGIAATEALAPLIEQSDAVVVGPGLGRSEWGRALWSAAQAAQRPTVVDADGLNALADRPARRDNWVLTPHPGEAARLLQSTAAKVQADRCAAVRALAAAFGGVAVLKGAGTLIADRPDRALSLCDRGNPGMATAGMGDVLAGVIGALLAQGVNLRDAANAGVYLHAVAGDEAAREGERGMVASDLMAPIRRLANPR